MEIAARLGVPLGTVAWWRHQARTPGRVPAAQVACAVCDGRPHTLGAAYAYLLGSYLGDGTVLRSRRSWRLQIYQDHRYLGVVGAIAGAVEAVLPGTAGFVQLQGCVAVGSHSLHWPCMLPVGPGRKHLRKIELLPWQQDVVARHAIDLVRGCLHSDGCRVINRVTTRGKRYEYPRYFFSNVSEDIKDIFCGACDVLGVGYHRTPRYVSVAKQADVAALDAHGCQKW